MSRRVFAAAILISVLPLLPAAADHRPVVYPDGTIVHGDWGLHRPGHIQRFAEPPYAIHFYVPDYFAPSYPVPFYNAPAYVDAPHYYAHRRYFRPRHVVPVPEPRTYYFPSNIGDPYAYKPAATRAPSVRGPRYQRTWSTQPNTPADINEPPVEGPYVIPAPEAK